MPSQLTVTTPPRKAFITGLQIIRESISAAIHRRYVTLTFTDD